MAQTRGYETQGGLATIRRNFVEFTLRERTFLLLLGAMFMAAGVVYPQAAIARWVGFGFAAYSAVANDSIQTIGTFIASNRKQRWWVLWLFIGGVFLATVGYSWVTFDGDVTYQRLASKGFENTPTEFSFLQLAAPLFLLILTRLRRLTSGRTWRTAFALLLKDLLYVFIGLLISLFLAAAVNQSFYQEVVGVFVAT